MVLIQYYLIFTVYYYIGLSSTDRLGEQNWSDQHVRMYHGSGTDATRARRASRHIQQQTAGEREMTIQK